VTPFPRADYASLRPYDPGRSPVPVDLSDNTNLWGPHPAALARLQAATPDDLRCYPEVYADTLRAAAAARFGVEPSCVTTGDGSDDILDSAFRAAAAAGATVTYPAPTFSMVGDFARMNGMLPVPVDDAVALTEPEALLERDPAVVYLCRPNNPTGGSAPVDWVVDLLRARGPAGPLVVIDEAYADFAGETLIEVAMQEPKVLVARTCSKAYGLAGMRCGFALGRPETVFEVEKSRGPYKVSRLTAEVVAAALRDEQGWVAARVAECVENRRRLWKELAARKLVPLESRANFILFRATSGSSADDARALREDGVQVRPFAKISGPGEGLRVTVGPWPLLETFLEAMDRRLAALSEVAPR
jgi:histidinol-phosphate aminotransferase